MIKVTAKIKLFKGPSKRNTPISNGYRPTFNFIEESRTSGSMQLKEDLIPGQERVIEIHFLNNDYLGEDFGPGTTFSFFEGEEALGEGMIISIL